MVVTNPLAVPTIMCLQVYRRVFGTHCLPVIVLDYWGLAVCIGGGNDFMVHCLLCSYPIPPGVELNCSEGVLPAGGQCTLIVTVKPWQRAHAQVAIKYKVVLQEDKEGGG